MSYPLVNRGPRTHCLYYISLTDSFPFLSPYFHMVTLFLIPQYIPRDSQKYQWLNQVHQSHIKGALLVCRPLYSSDKTKTARYMEFYKMDFWVGDHFIDNHNSNLMKNIGLIKFLAVGLVQICQQVMIAYLLLHVQNFAVTTNKKYKYNHKNVFYQIPIMCHFLCYILYITCLQPPTHHCLLFIVEWLD